MTEEKTLLCDEPVWVSTWDHNNPEGGYITEGPGQFRGIVTECDGIRGIDHIIVSRVAKSHHHPDDVFKTKEEADKRTEWHTGRHIRRKRVAEHIGAVNVETSHDPGENHRVKV